MTVHPTVSVLVVNYYTESHLPALFSSLATAGQISREVILVNHSPENALPVAAQPDLKIIPSPNRGYARGNNLAFAHAQGKFVLVCNPDIQFTPGSLSIMVAKLESEPSIGLLLPKLIYEDGARQPSTRRFYDWKSAVYARWPWRNAQNFPSFFRHYLMAEMDGEKTQDVDWGLGAAMLVRRDALGSKGLFDPRYFLYFEDVDLCYRVWKNRWRVTYDPTTVLIHAHERASAKSWWSKAWWYHLTSFGKFVLKHRGLPARPHHLSSAVE